MNEIDHRRLFEASPNAYLVLSPALRILDANPAWLALVDGARDAYVGRCLFDAFPPRLQDAARELRSSFRNVIENRRPHTIPLLHYPVPGDAEGHWRDRYWLVNNAPLFDARGQVEAILNCPLDVTHLVLAEGETDARARVASGEHIACRITAQLTHERRRLRQLMQQAPGFVAVGQGPAHVFELANDAYYQLVGHRDIIGKPVRSALPDLEGQGFYELLDQVYASGQPFVGRAMPIQLQHTPGAPPVQRYIDFIYQPILDEDGQVSGIFVQGHDVTDAHELALKVSYQAAHDALTGLFNRREFEARLARAVAGPSDRPGPHSLLYLDLDQFKVVNDTCGHAAGDELLRQVSRLLAAHVAPEHTLARLGGDEFGLLLEGTSTPEAVSIAESLRRAVESLAFHHGHRVFGCSASLGVATFDTNFGTPQDVLSEADAACFLAKEKGRNRVQVHTADDGELLRRRREMDWVGRLRIALAERRILLHAQRIEPLRTELEKRTRLELLVRLRDEDGTIVPPMAFIPAAERYGLMPAIDRFILREACEYLCALPARQRGRTTLSVNLSGTTLNDERLLPFVEELLAEHPLAAGSLCFEITETAAIHDLTRTTQLMQGLKRLGFHFALDDFGSGMSSLCYLKHLPVDYLKIDGTFVRHVTRDATDAAMVEAIARVAAVLGIRTVAEYVEDDATLQLLASLGVDFAQGYGVHVPEPLATVLTLEPETP